MTIESQSDGTLQFLTFRLGAEVYALSVNKTREVVDFTNITPLPQTPDWIRGVLNLRGNVVPVLDLKHRLGMGPTEQTATACVLILELEVNGEKLAMGVLADSVQEVLEIEQRHIEPPPRLGAKVSTAFVRGMGRRGDRLFIILDVDRVFASSDVELATESAAEASAPGGAPVSVSGQPKKDEASPGAAAAA